MESTVGMSGVLGTKVIKAPKPSLEWQLRQWLRKDRFQGLIDHGAAKAFAKIFRMPVMYGKLNAVHVNGKTGERINYGVVSRRLVTTVFVEYMVDELVAETTAWGDFKFHDSGEGTTPAAIGDSAIETTDNESRATGTQLEGATGEIYKSVGTITYSGTLAITEHGLFNIATAGILMDRHVFTAINVENTDSIEFTYELTVDDGG